jgi:hypothetical protein
VRSNGEHGAERRGHGVSTGSDSDRVILQSLEVYLPVHATRTRLPAPHSARSRGAAYYRVQPRAWTLAANIRPPAFVLSNWL